MRRPRAPAVWRYGETVIQRPEEEVEVWGDSERPLGGGMVIPRFSLKRKGWRYGETTGVRSEEQVEV